MRLKKGEKSETFLLPCLTKLAEFSCVVLSGLPERRLCNSQGEKFKFQFPYVQQNVTAPFT